MIRPVGVVSKKYMGARSIFWSIASKSSADAPTPLTYTNSDFRYCARIASPLMAAYTCR